MASSQAVGDWARGRRLRSHARWIACFVLGGALLVGCGRSGTSSRAAGTADSPPSLPNTAQTGATSTCGSSKPIILSVETTVAGIPTTRPPIGASVTVTVTAYDPDTSVKCADGVASYAWSMVGEPGGSTVAVPADNTGNSLAFTVDLAGTYQFRVVATDKFNNASDPVIATVASGPCGPTVSGLIVSDSPYIPGTPISLSAGNVTDACITGGPDPTSAWSLVTRPSGSVATMGSDGNVATFTPDVAGLYTAQLVVTDNAGLSTILTRDLVVTACTASPVVTSVGVSPPSPKLGDTVTLTATATSACSGTTLSYSWTMVSRPAASSSAVVGSGNTATFMVDVANAPYQVAVTAADSLGHSSAPFIVTVDSSTCGLSRPEITAVAVTNPLDGSPVSRPAVGTDVQLTASSFDPNASCSGDNTITYDWSLVSAPAGSVATPPQTSGASALFTADFAGTYQFKVVAYDSLGLASDPLLVTVPTGSCGPQLSGPIAFAPVAPTVGFAVTLTAGTISDTCIAGAIVSEQWSLASRPSGSSAVIAPATAANPVLVPDVAGTYEVELVLTDQGGFSTVYRGVLVVGGCTTLPAIVGQPTVFMATDPQLGTIVGTIAYRDDVVQLAMPLYNGSAGLLPGSCGDATSSTFSYEWTMLARPAGSHAALSSTTDRSPAFVVDVAGPYSLMLVVRDGYGNTSAPYLFTIPVSACGALRPAASFTPSSWSPDANSWISLTATAPSDPDASCPARFQNVNGTYEYAWSVVGQPVGSSFTLTGSNTANASFQANAGGAYAIQLTVTNFDGASGSTTQSLTVSACGSVPPVTSSFTFSQNGSTATAAAGGSTNVPYVGFPVTVTPMVTDADASCGFAPESVTYAWSMTSAPAGSRAVLDDPSKASPSFSPDLAGTYQFALTTTDPYADSATAVVGVTVGTCGSAPPVVQLSNGIPLFYLAQNVPSWGSPPQTLTIVRSTDYFAASQVNKDTEFYVGYPVQLSAAVTDADAGCLPETISYAWSITGQPPGSGARLSDPAAQFPSIVPDVPGEYDLQLVLTDSTGRSSTTQLQFVPNASPPRAAFSVGSCGSQQPMPTIAVTDPFPAPPFTSVAEPRGSVVALQGADESTTGSACGLQASYAWTLVSRPPSSSTGVVPGSGAGATLTLDQDGAYVVQLTVTIGARSASTTATIETTPSTVAALDGSSWMVAQAVDGTGAPIVAWIDSSAVSSPIRVARCTAGCSTNDPTWTLLPIADYLGPTPFTWAANEEPRPLDVKVGANGYVYLAYAKGCEVDLAMWNGSVWTAPRYVYGGTGCDAGFTVGSQAGRWLSLALSPNSEPAVAFSYQDRGTSQSGVYYADCINTAGCADLTVALALSPGPTFGNATSGRWPSLAIAGAMTAMVYTADGQDGAITGLYYGECIGGSCTVPGNWSFNVVANTSGANVGRYASLALAQPRTLGNSPQPRLAYADLTSSGAVLLAQCSQSCAAGSGAWTPAMVDDGAGSGGVGYGTVLALDGHGDPALVYRDATNARIKIARASSLTGPFDKYSVMAATGLPALQLTASGGASVVAPTSGTVQSILLGR